MNNDAHCPTACSTCGTQPATPCTDCERRFCASHGGTAWVSRHFFGPRLIPKPQDLCGLCQSHRIWAAWRVFVVLIAVVASAVAALEGQPWAAAVLIPVGGIWWWVAATRLREVARERNRKITHGPTEG